jgi:ABC-2 type transport system ATP-binding protein
MIQNGKLIKTEKVETLINQQFRRIEINFRKEPPHDAFTLEGVNEISRDGNLILFEISQDMDQLMEKATPYGIIDIETKAISLEEIFLAFYGPHNKGEEDV